MTSIIPFFCGLGLSLCVAALLIRRAASWRLMDYPNGRHTHPVPVPRVGGLAMIASLGLGWVAGGFRPDFRGEEWACILVLATCGFLDDRFDLRARWKAVVGLLAAIVLAIGASHRLLQLHQAHVIFGVALPQHFAVYFSLLLVMYWSLPQAFNLIDGANGLATGYGLIVLGSLWAAGHARPFMAGVLGALLLLNWPRSRLFLGDCGSLSLGLILAMLVKKAAAPIDPGHILWIFAYPIVDVSMVVLIRIAQGRSPGQADRNHLHFQWVDRWPSMEPWRVPLLLFLAALCASELFLTGPWQLLPWLGLAGLLGQAAYFFIATLAPGMKGRKPAYRANEIPDPVKVLAGRGAGAD